VLVGTVGVSSMWTPFVVAIGVLVLALAVVGIFVFALLLGLRGAA
jgi:hypothetical protein